MFFCPAIGWAAGKMGNQIEVAGNGVVSDHADAKLGSCG